MVGVFFGILFLIGGIIVGSYLKKVTNTTCRKDSFGNYVKDASGNKIEDVTHPYKKIGTLVTMVGIVVFIIGLVEASFCTVKTGHTGVVTTFGKVLDYTLDSGVHVKAPWNSVIQMDNRVQKATINLSCFSSDIQEVNTVYTVNYQISKTNAQDLYKTVGTGYLDTVITPTVYECVKTIMAHYTAEDLIGQRDSLATEVETLLGEQLLKYNIEVASTAIEDMDFTDAFTNAVEEKQVAAQNKLKAEIEQAQAIKQAEADAQVAKTKALADAEVAKTKAEADAEVAKIQANADLEVQKINADAAEYTGQKEAAKNKAINESLTGDLLKYYQIQQWNGVYPSTYVGSDNVTAILGSE